MKFVIANKADWDYARELIQRLNLAEKARAILISPVWNEIDLRELAGWITASGLDVRMQLQLHKYIWGAEARGV